MWFHTGVGLQNKVIVGLGPALLFCAGCTSTMPDRDVRMTRAYIYYLDGAGGAGVIRNWSRGVRKGFLDAGYDGAGEVFVWQTRLGIAADQLADVRYKRSKAAELAAAIQGGASCTLIVGAPKHTRGSGGPSRAIALCK